MKDTKKILFFVRSVQPYLSQRKDVDNIIFKLLELGHSVDIYDVHQSKLINARSREEKSFNLLPKLINKAWLKKLFNLFALRKFCISYKNKYDTVAIFFIREELLLLPNHLNSLSKKMILFHYGSDVNKRNWIKKRFTKLYFLSHAMLFGTEDLMIKQLNYIGKSESLKKKSNTILLPVEHLKEYSSFSFEQKLNAKRKLGFPTNKPLVVLGSTGAPLEQHLLALKNIINVSKNFYLYIPLSNRTGKFTRYVNSIKEFLKESYEGEYMIQDEFKSFEYINDLRSASDIFINVRKTDQLCLAMIESNLSYSQVITGTWLPNNWYVTRYEIGTIEKMKDLAEKIMEFIKEKPQSLRSKALSNHKFAKDDFINDDYYKPWINYLT